MKLIKTLDEISEQNIALTIGNFDGIHLGHRFVISSIRKRIDAESKMVVITFSPHPSEVLNPRTNYLLNNKDDKYKMLEDLGVDYLFEIDFTRDLSTLSGIDFLNKYFNSTNKKISFFLGYDFSFGANKKDGVGIIKSFCNEKGYKYSVLDKHSTSDLSISSSKIRESLYQGKVEEANKYLGRDFFIEGTIVKGEGRGKQIGFPTANLQYAKERIVPGKGVYSTSVLYKKGMYKSVTNIGVKPTFEKDADMTVETFLLDFDKDIYGEKFTLFFHGKLRDEIKFNSVNDLIEQIRDDVETRRKSD